MADNVFLISTLKKYRNDLLRMRTIVKYMPDDDISTADMEALHSIIDNMLFHHEIIDKMIKRIRRINMDEVIDEDLLTVERLMEPLHAIPFLLPSIMSKVKTT